jgi:hypothetical protein
MPGSRVKHYTKTISYSESCSDSDSSSSSSNSSSSSSSDKHKKYRKHIRKYFVTDSDCSDSHSEIESYSNDKDSKDSDHSSSSECKVKYDINEIYQYFKNRLVLDKELMVAGSNAYVYAGNKQDQAIPRLHAVKFENLYMNQNIDLTHPNSPYHVREDGIYVLFFCMATDSAAQFTIFVNGIVQPLTSIGSNSGAGQIISRHLLALRKDDNVLIRNYISNNTVNSQTKAGGLTNGNDLVCLLIKVAPLCNPKECCEEIKCLPHKKLRLFRKLTEKLLADVELMVKGFNVTGSFYNTTEQPVATESDVVFGAFQNVNGLQWNPTGANPEQIKVLEDGVYKLFFMCNTNNPAQFAFCVNGVPDENTTSGSNRGAAQVSLRALLTLKQNDIITVRNHTSANSAIVISKNAGGFQPTVSALLTMFKISPIVKPEIKPVNCKVEKKFDCDYFKFRNYLLCKEWLQITGSPAYLSMTGSSPQEVFQNDALSYSTNVLVKDVCHVQGSNYLTVEKSGLYDIFVDTITDEAFQYTLLVNGVPDMSTVSGRESGAARTLLRQLVKLNKGDKVQAVNYQSHMGTVHTSVNPGGEYVGNNKQFMLFMMTPTCEPKPDVSEISDSDSESDKSKESCKPKDKCKNKPKNKDKCKPKDSCRQSESYRQSESCRHTESSKHEHKHKSHKKRHHKH